MELEIAHDATSCYGILQPVSDALYILSGKWKLPILIALRFGNKRFGQLAREIPNITEKMLSKELRALEINQLVKRTVYDTIPVTVEYSLTEYGFSLDKVIAELAIWGIEHRKLLIAENKNED
ncbi:winged helix-turn-helix transcriptional regulator [Flavobacterium sp. W22_SRS_FK3]|uniref:winged helix-turn-helix transcriptional regulator n=1 Tax=Flavobacterium sp. W22_SRS_FK3 TaxID=3240275 RepID=UPI003F8DDA0C